MTNNTQNSGGGSFSSGRKRNFRHFGPTPGSAASQIPAERPESAAEPAARTEPRPQEGPVRAVRPDGQGRAGDRGNRSRDNRQNRSGRDAHDGREGRSMQDGREGRSRDNRRDHRDNRAARDLRDGREPRDLREPREPRENRERRESRDARANQAGNRDNRERRDGRPQGDRAAAQRTTQSANTRTEQPQTAALAQAENSLSGAAGQNGRAEPATGSAVRERGDAGRPGSTGEPRADRAATSGARAEKSAGDARGERSGSRANRWEQKVKAEETTEDIRRDNERIEKEIWLEIAGIHTIKLDY